MKKYIITIILLAVLAAIVFGLCGCVTIEGTLPNGQPFKYQRIGNQEIGSFIVEADGSILFERQKSDNETLYQAINKLVDKIP